MPCSTWTVGEMEKSSTWRELAAVARVLESITVKLENHRVRWSTDNQNVARIISVGSRVPELQILATNIFHMALRYQISIEPEWIPRDLNGLADYISKIVDYDDWMLNPEVVSTLDDLRPAYTAEVSGTCFWNSNTKQLGDLFQKQKIKGSLWNLCAVYAGLYGVHIQ